MIDAVSDGGERYLRNRAAGVVDRIVRPHGSAIDNDIMAKAAEVYFARRYGLPVPHNRRPTDWEFHVEDATIDVKWTPYESGYLIHAMSSKTRATFYVLVVGTEKTFAIAGWQWGFILHQSVVGPPRFPVACYGLPQDNLRHNIDIQMATLGRLRQ